MLQAVVAERGAGILLVEHDMALVMDVCEHIYVLDFGRPLFEGTPDEVRASERAGRLPGIRRRGARRSHRTSGDRLMLELRDVVGGYGDTTVLREISLTVPDGSVVALLGPNGAGKTTTLRIASGLLRPRSGSVLLDGQDIARLSPYRRAALGICHIPEGRAIFPSLTVRDNVTVYACRGTEKDAWDRAVETFPVLGSRRGQVAGTLSGGEQQMLASRASWSNPRVVLVDEASLGLAPLVVDDIFEFLEKLAARGTSLLLVEQYVNRALALADSVYLLNQGTIVYDGPAAGLDEDRIFELYTGTVHVPSV